MTRILIACLSLALVAVSLAVFPLAADDVEREIDELREVAARKAREAEEHSQAGHRDEARELAGEADRLRERAEVMERERREPKEHPAERQQLEERLLDARSEAKELWEAGRPEDAERRLREVRELEQQLKHAGPHPPAEEHPRHAGHPRHGEHPRHEGHPPHGEHPRHAGHPRHHEELRRQLHHLHVAVENLHAAGRPELAGEVARHAEELERELHRRQEPAPGHEPHGADELRDVRNQLERLQDQMNALREIVERLHQR